MASKFHSNQVKQATKLVIKITFNSYSDIYIYKDCYIYRKIVEM